jgi:hypothetical protein
MADIVNITSEQNRSNDGNGKGEIASATKEVVELLDDDERQEPFVS